MVERMLKMTEHCWSGIRTFRISWVEVSNLLPEFHNVKQLEAKIIHLLKKRYLLFIIRPTSKEMVQNSKHTSLTFIIESDCNETVYLT